ncbi:tripartite tricarboxylate transporter TctB family protein [Paracoccus suum]|uniref:Tripartite tricarboxylate transporter TctB family protein n=1 Tax=Paracoccus suum TaxID=2259340 RepID=A0A344PMP3_9RHOB|nr:tripartite tricarboxylate transporter TctB family protein [Paracoccus suum]AXC50648.1 tripartite tricarboxylate transporter TctB family protein [Paracoccus suum]
MIRERWKSSDAITGILFCLISIGFMIGGRNLPLGTASRMGAGWFPMAVAGCMLLVGVIILVRASLETLPAPTAFVWRPIVLIAAALVVFALTLERLGLVFAVPLSVMVSAYAHPPVAVRRMLVYALLLGIACSIVFVKWLGLQVPIVGAWLEPFLGRW